MTATTPRLFDEVSALVGTHAGQFTAAVDPEWTIAGKPNGGYLLAMLGRAAAATTTHEHVIAASAHYLHAPEPGPVSIETDLLRAGRSASQVRATMSQAGARCVEALLTTSRLERSVTPFWDGGLPQISSVSYEDAVPLVARTPDGGRVAIMDQIDVRLDPDSAGFTIGAPRGRGELRGWLQLPGGESFDTASLLFAVDAFPPATFDVQFSGWVPTLELTVYVRALPAPGPVRILQRARLIDHQRVDEACFVWDSTGRLVAQGTQLAGIRLG
ncbi:MAG TPA: thioesterase family protein [Solirubrobacteraceae bacterium]|nr:thioesterase family protein [Solirubrobacteraceae bacterium]